MGKAEEILDKNKRTWEEKGVPCVTYSDAIRAMKKCAKEEAIEFAEWMRKNEVEIASDEKGESAFDIGVQNYTAIKLYEFYLKDGE